jgi:hypothetical protein
MHYITDVGFVGPDQGKGGRYLFVRADYEGPIPDGYFVIRTPSNRNLLFFRFFIEGGNVDAAVESARRDFNIYPLALAGEAPPVRIVDMTGKQYNTIFSNDFSYFEELNRVVQNEPPELFDAQLYGTFAAIGIRKGEPFEPDARTRKLLNDAVAIGNAYARAITFAPRDSEKLRVWPDRQYFDWKWTWDFTVDGALSLDDRTRWYYSVTGHSESMVTPQVGVGSVYPLFRARRERRLSGWQQDLQHDHARPGPGPQLLGLHRVRHPDSLPAGDRPALRGHRQQPGRPHPQPGWQLHRLVRPRNRPRDARATGCRPCPAAATS